MIQDARIAFTAGIHRNALTDLRRLEPGEFDQLLMASEEFLADGNVTELRALQSTEVEFTDPLPGFIEHPDHIDVREALRAAAAKYNEGFLGVPFGIEIDLDETFGPLGSEADSPRPTCQTTFWIDGVPHVHYNYQLKTFEADEPALAEYLIADVLDDSFEEPVLVRKGLRENEMDFRIQLVYTHVSDASANQSAE